MPKRIFLRNFALSVSLLVMLCAFRAKADVIVTDSFGGFSPDPVYIVTGEAVYWYDDGTGPYTIYSRTSAWVPFETPGGVLFSQVGTYNYFDDNGSQGTIYVTPNTPPSVTITNPANNAVLTAPATFIFGADASDPDAGGLSDVEFYVGTNLVDDVFSSPFTTTITNLTVGTYVLTAIAYDHVFATATNSITITVAPKLTTLNVVAGQFRFNTTGLTIGKTNVLQTSTNLAAPTGWVSIATNVATSSSASFTNTVSTGSHFFRLRQLP